MLYDDTKKSEVSNGVNKKSIIVSLAILIIIVALYLCNRFGLIGRDVPLLPSESERVAVLEKLSSTSSSTPVSQSKRRDVLDSLEELSTTAGPSYEDKIKILESLQGRAY